jgi:hypothetical protein
VGRLRGRLDKLQEKSGYQRWTLVCPECGQEFTVYGDVALEVIVHQWSSQVPDQVLGELVETPEDVRRLFDHEHDPSAFVDKASGLPFLTAPGVGFNLREPPDSEAGKDAT